MDYFTGPLREALTPADQKDKLGEGTEAGSKEMGRALKGWPGLVRGPETLSSPGEIGLAIGGEEERKGDQQG